ncbi:MAG TPA: septum formation initiator family protein [Chitinispirillaceae bacterium]|jgi:cell division protein FtsB|nr:septum formation initiator family protein [Chitinispirillaceae bacterium]
MRRKKIAALSIGFVMSAVLVFMFTGKQGFISLYKNHQQYKLQQEQLIRSHHVIDSLKTEIKRLHNDTTYLEKIARERLGMAKKNEMIYKFVDK